MSYEPPPYTFARASWLPLDGIAAIDTETGGLSPMKHALLSVAVWTPEDGVTEFLVQPDGLCEAEALKINGLDPRECREKGLSRKEAAEKLSALLRGRVIVGQNVGFDLSFIAHRIFGIKPRTDAARLLQMLPVADTHDIFKQLHPDEPRHLGEIAAYYGVNPHPESAHSAGYDAEMTGRAYQAMVREMNKRTIDEVKELADADAQR